MKTALRSCAVVFASIALMGQTSPKDVDGWGKIKWGMTIAEVRAAYSLPRTSKDFPGTANRGPAIVLEPVNIGDISMKVLAVAKKGSNLISNVELSNVLAGSESFDNIKTLLIQKYGRPVNEEKKVDDFNARVTTVLWTFPSTSILLTLRQGTVIFLDYTATDKKALDAL